MWTIEVTDTFGGEANYSWVRRYEMDAHRGECQASIMRRAKAIAGYSGVRGRTSPMGEGFEFRPYRVLHVMFVTWRDA
jgi:hypothetical protein